MGEARTEWDAEGVRALRERLGLTQRELADELGVRQQTISDWETSAYRPRGASARMLRHVAERAASYDPAPGTGRSPRSGDRDRAIGNRDSVAETRDG